MESKRASALKRELVLKEEEKFQDHYREEEIHTV